MFKKESPKELCPFSWIAQKKGCASQEAVWEPVPCLRDRCKLWDSNAENCVFNNLKKNVKKSNNK